MGPNFPLKNRFLTFKFKRCIIKMTNGSGVRMGKKETTEEKIISAAIREFNSFGYEGANTNRIAELAGVSKGTVFLRFGTKINLFCSCLERIMRTFEEGAKKIDFSGGKDIFDKLDMFVRFKLRFFEKYKEESKFILNNYLATKVNEELSEKCLPILMKNNLQIRDSVFNSDFDLSGYKPGLTYQKIFGYIDLVLSGFNARFERYSSYEDFPFDKLVEEWTDIISALKFGIMK